ncbi:MAG: hypothetical protein M1825_003220 [Sarcosagium campestre]|nr:MAG: hypothetical protein M1825_003220 [Sarcosagium campestre]
MTLALTEAPKMYSEDPMIEKLSIRRASRSPKTRVGGVAPLHTEIASNCLVYRLHLDASSHQIKALLRTRQLPSSIAWPTSVFACCSSLADEQYTLMTSFAHQHDFWKFEVLFQIQKLSQNAYLPPKKIAALKDEMANIIRRSGAPACAEAIKKLSSQTPYAGPDINPSELSVPTLVGILTKSESQSHIKAMHNQELAVKFPHIAPIQRATVTPVGVYLEGPDRETKNRVLRKYPGHVDYFLRVTFADENGENIRHDITASNKELYKRFEGVLNDGIMIAGRNFEFLGFSHSSLRAHTCWFMAPFAYKGRLLHARAVIADLGDFSSIKSAAKCAARIGQAFSDTFNSIHLPIDSFFVMDDVERNGRKFSDGVGTISLSVLQELWRSASRTRKLKPTLFQIRYAGAKGMISYDRRLSGHQMRLRPSMIKFDAPNANEIEICGDASRPLPLFLNRQVIKILEDLGVPSESFLELQNAAVDQLRSTTLTCDSAADFLKQNQIGKATHLPWLMRKLDRMGLPFPADTFLEDALETAVLIQLRQLKYKARIPVKNGFTLYGIMDETGYLKEGEIFVVTETDKSERSVLIGEEVIVTRSPALHPGDVQRARAVDVPDDSALNALSNCVVFSQFGERDLPSQLSGGDLDGDLFQIIFDQSLSPSCVVAPADYPRAVPVDALTKVEKHHMTGFFIKFMENDQLGRIATWHLLMADQKAEGTRDEYCMRLAEKHSTAVDFSKTGIAVDLFDLEPQPKSRPDFMATGPQVTIEKGPRLTSFEEEDDDAPEDDVDALDPDRAPYTYYESEKVLGALYREIDEETVMRDIHQQARILTGNRTPAKNVMKEIWIYVKRETSLIQWEHYKEWATEIRDMYEDHLIETMTQFSTHATKPISEVEVYVGNIVGKTGAGSRQQREKSKSMRETYDMDVIFTINCIIKGEDQGEEAVAEEALARSIACLAVGMEQTQSRARVGMLRSFSYIAAAVCLKEIEKMKRGEGVQG